MNNYFIKDVSDIEMAIKDWKSGLLSEAEFEAKIYKAARSLALIEEMEMRAKEESRLSLQDLGQRLGVV